MSGNQIENVRKKGREKEKRRQEKTKIKKEVGKGLNFSICDFALPLVKSHKSSQVLPRLAREMFGRLFRKLEGCRCTNT